MSTPMSGSSQTGGPWPLRSWPTGEVVPQAVVAEYVWLRESARRRQKRAAMLRDRILAELAAGAKVEPGRWTAAVKRSVQRRLTLGRLTALVGEESARWLQGQVEPTPTVQLVVGEDPRHRPPTPPSRHRGSDGLL